MGLSEFFKNLSIKRIFRLLKSKEFNDCYIAYPKKHPTSFIIPDNVCTLHERYNQNFSGNHSHIVEFIGGKNLREVLWHRMHPNYNFDEPVSLFWASKKIETVDMSACDFFEEIITDSFRGSSIKKFIGGKGLKKFGFAVFADTNNFQVLDLSRCENLQYVSNAVTMWAKDYIRFHKNVRIDPIDPNQINILHCKDIEVPICVTEIPAKAAGQKLERLSFQEDSNLLSINPLAFINAIGLRYADFSNCTNYSNGFDGTNGEYQFKKVVSNFKNVEYLHLPPTVTSITANYFENNKSLKTIKASGIRTICKDAFKIYREGSLLKTLTVDLSNCYKLEKIEEGAFDQSVEKIILPPHYNIGAETIFAFNVPTIITEENGVKIAVMDSDASLQKSSDIKEELKKDFIVKEELERIKLFEKKCDLIEYALKNQSGIDAEFILTDISKLIKTEEEQETYNKLAIRVSTKIENDKQEALKNSKKLQEDIIKQHIIDFENKTKSTKNAIENRSGSDAQIELDALTNIAITDDEKQLCKELKAKVDTKISAEIERKRAEEARKKAEAEAKAKAKAEAEAKAKAKAESEAKARAEAKAKEEAKAKVSATQTEKPAPVSAPTPAKTHTHAEIEAFKNALSKAENGDNDSKIKIAECYERGVGVDINPQKAFEWYIKGGLDYNNWSKGHAFMGDCYYDGVITTTNLEKAYYHYLIFYTIYHDNSASTEETKQKVYFCKKRILELLATVPGIKNTARGYLNYVMPTLGKPVYVKDLAKSIQEKTNEAVYSMYHTKHICTTVEYTHSNLKTTTDGDKYVDNLTFMFEAVGPLEYLGRDYLSSNANAEIEAFREGLRKIGWDEYYFNEINPKNLTAYDREIYYRLKEYQRSAYDSHSYAISSAGSEAYRKKADYATLSIWDEYSLCDKLVKVKDPETREKIYVKVIGGYKIQYKFKSK